jgi:hypothetical protein
MQNLELKPAILALNHNSSFAFNTIRLDFDFMVNTVKVKVAARLDSTAKEKSLLRFSEIL